MFSLFRSKTTPPQNNLTINGKPIKGNPKGEVNINFGTDCNYSGIYLNEDEKTDNGSIYYFDCYYTGGVKRFNNIFIKHGYGKLIFSVRKQSIEGEWINGIISYGKLQNKNIIFEGEIKQQQDVFFSNKGIYFIDNAKIKFKDETNTYGIITYDNGNIFEGKIDNFMPTNGKKTYFEHPTFESISGEYYNGSFKNDFTINYKSGCILYEKRDDIKFKLPNGDILTGSKFFDTYRLNKIIYLNGSLYIGEIKYNKCLLQNGVIEYCKHGKGKWYKNDGTSIKTIFENDTIVNNSLVIETLEDDTKLTYIIIDSKRSGEGYIERNNLRYYVYWIDNEPYTSINGTHINDLNKSCISINCSTCNQDTICNINDNKILNCDINPNNICSICYENPVNVTLPICRHTFCNICLVKIKKLN